MSGTEVLPAGPRALELSIGGMTCASCAARVERKLNKLEGVSASVNYATERATVRTSVPIETGRLVAQVESAGYSAHMIEPEAREAGAIEESNQEGVRYLWRRLVVALLVGVPLADLSITLALVPSLRFAGWQWVLLALTMPVVTWCAWPFHHKAFNAARRGTSSMDTLVSLGITAASGWSVYTIFARGESGRADSLWGLILDPADPFTSTWRSA